MSHSARRVALLLLVLVALPATLVVPRADAAVCAAGLETMEGAGLVCPHPNGLYEVFDAHLRSVGYVHGVDPAPTAALGDDVLAAGSTDVECVSGAPGSYHIQVIYARAFDDEDRYATILPKVRALTANANRLVDEAALATGKTASLRVKCVDGLVEVANEVLPTRLADSHFGTIAGDLRDAGYDDGHVKYWVFFDDARACSCGGMGNIFYDETPTASNWNNGNAGPMFAMTFGYETSTRIWLHELGHNLGAVQEGSPHSSLAAHCYDGRDTMCYADGGANESLYSTTWCASEVWDCGNDDYFHAAPPAGSYLATHWNVGSGVNRFLRIEDAQTHAPTLVSVSCSPDPVEAGASTTCVFRATDPDATGLRYTIEWGDGATSVAPEKGWAAPGSSMSAPHSYATEGEWIVSVTASDTAPHTSAPLSTTVDVVSDLRAPTISVVDPQLKTLYEGCAEKRVLPLGPTFWRNAGCVRVELADAKSGVHALEVYLGGALVGVDESAPYEIEVPNPGPGVLVPLEIVAIDHAGNRASVIRQVTMLNA